MCDWDQSFAEHMSNANWETVELIAEPATMRILGEILARDGSDLHP